MNIAAPSDGELEALLSEHAGRFPEKFTTTVIGDGGKQIRIPLLLANPTGSGARPCRSNAWSAVISAALRLKPEPPNLASLVAEDSLLWPRRPEWAACVQRWPGIPKSVADCVERKIAGSLEEPAYDEPAPDRLADALAKHPRAAWRKLKTSSEVFSVVIEPPQSHGWRFFIDAASKPNADAWLLVREVAVACVEGCVGADGAAVAIDLMFCRWPGLVVSVIGEVGKLVGASAEVELGGW